MHIKCTNCEKSFEIDEKLIPEKGRLLQCGNCNFKWFYKKEKKQTKQIIQDIPEKKIQINPNQDLRKDENKLKKKEKNNINFFKYFLVLIITFVAIIIIIDTFKSQIEIFYPNIEIWLNNLYQSLQDIVLFFKDLVK